MPRITRKRLVSISLLTTPCIEIRGTFLFDLTFTLFNIWRIPCRFGVFRGMTLFSFQDFAKFFVALENETSELKGLPIES